ncbi:MAG: hypothetical protein ACJ72M_12145 [Propionibacteriaceae bacterium]
MLRTSLDHPLWVNLSRARSTTIGIARAANKRPDSRTEGAYVLGLLGYAIG